MTEWSLRRLNVGLVTSILSTEFHQVHKTVNGMANGDNVYLLFLNVVVI